MKCGFYETEITPPLGTTIYGYFTRRINSGIKTKLYAKACVLEQDGTTCAMLVLDALCVPPTFPAFIRQYVRAKTGIDPNALMITATHSHTAFPTTADLGIFQTPNILENEPELDPELDGKALEWIKLLAADTVVHAFQRLHEAQIRFGTGTAQGISYVREYVLEDGTVRTNPNYCLGKILHAYSEPDRSGPVFFFTDADGNPMGSITSFALHHDTVSGNEISADYSGYLSQHLKRAYGNEFISVFFPGFCGNINHLDYLAKQRGEKDRKTAAETGSILYAEVRKIIATAAPIAPALKVTLETVKIRKRRIPEGFVDSVKALLKNPPPFTAPMSIADPYSDRMKYASSARVIAYYGQAPAAEFDVPVQVIKIGNCLIWALPGEVFCQFADKLRDASPTENNLFVEMANHTDHPYIPPKDMFLPYVYESSYYSSRFEPDAGDIMTDKAIELAKAMF